MEYFVGFGTFEMVEEIEEALIKLNDLNIEDEGTEELMRFIVNTAVRRIQKTSKIVLPHFDKPDNKKKIAKLEQKIDMIMQLPNKEKYHYEMLEKFENALSELKQHERTAEHQKKVITGSDKFLEWFKKYMEFTSHRKVYPEEQESSNLLTL